MKRSNFSLVAFVAFLALLANTLNTMAQSQTNTNMVAIAHVQKPNLNPIMESLEMAHTTPKVSLLPDVDGELIQVLNPEKSLLSFEIKNAQQQSVNAWVPVNYEYTDVNQALHVADLKAGVYWVEVSSPGKQSVSIKWEKK